MSEVKERIIGALTIMREEEAEKLWNIIKQNYGTEFEMVEPTEDEIATLEAYERGDEEYQPYMSIKEAEKMLLG